MNFDGVLSHRAIDTTHIENFLLFTRAACLLTSLAVLWVSGDKLCSSWCLSWPEWITSIIPFCCCLESSIVASSKWNLENKPKSFVHLCRWFFLVRKECNMFYSKMTGFLWGERNFTENSFQGVFSVSECKPLCTARYSFLLKYLLGKSCSVTTSPPPVQIASLWAACRSLYWGAQEPEMWHS